MAVLDPAEASVNPAVLVESESASASAWRRTVSRAADEPGDGAIRSRDTALWQLFARVVNEPAPKSLLELWRARAGLSATVEWLHDWVGRVRDLVRWQDLAPLAAEAAQVHQADWGVVENWARRVAAFEALGKPDPDWIFRTLSTLEIEPPSDGPVPILAMGEAIWMPGARLVVVNHPWRPLHPNPFRRESSIREWASRTDPHWIDRRAWGAWMKDPQAGCWLVGGDVPAEASGWTTRPTVTSGPTQHAAAHRVRTADWYDAWRDSSGHSSFTGRVAGGEASSLLPPRFSPSAIEDFGRCPLSFLLGRVLQIAEIPRDGDITAADTGQWAHRALEIMVRGQKALSRINVHAAVSQAVSEHPDTDNAPALFLSYQKARLASELYEALLREGWSPSKRSEVEVDIAWDWVWPMRGRLDRLDEEEDGSLRLIDYKTGEIPNPFRVSPANVQLLLYQKAVSQTYGKPVRAEYVGVSQRSEFRRRTVSFEEAAQLSQWVDDIGQGVKQRIAEKGFLPVPDPRLQPCRVCTFQLVCPHQVVEYVEPKNAALPEYGALWKGAQEESDDPQR
jgi:hypothetical protein